MLAATSKEMPLTWLDIKAAIGKPAHVRLDDYHSIITRKTDESPVLILMVESSIFHAI